MPTPCSNSLTSLPWPARSPKHTPPLPRRSSSTSARATCRAPGNRSDTLPNPHLPERTPFMSLPYVTDVSFKDGKIVLSIQLEKELANESVEISGYATQSNGAFATFYDIQSARENPAGKVMMF